MIPRDRLLDLVWRHPIRADNFEAGFDRFVALTGETIPAQQFQDAVLAAVMAGLIRDPVRLPEGALQCHWQLELTPAGRARLTATGVLSPEPAPPNAARCSTGSPVVRPPTGSPGSTD